MAISHELALIHYRSDRFREKLFAAMGIARRALEQAKRPYIAFSGGKDSLATFAVVELVSGGVQMAWTDDELEFPETVLYMTKFRDLAGTQLLMGKGSHEHAGWFTPWVDWPFWREPISGTIETPLGVRHHMEEIRRHDLVFLGLRMEENRRRRNWLAQAGPTYGGAYTIRTCNPLWDWTADDVWAMIIGQGLPYNPIYDRLEDMAYPRHRQRCGPMVLAPRRQLAEGWPDVLAVLEQRYSRRWTE